MYYDINDHTDNNPSWDDDNDPETSKGEPRPSWGDGLPTALNAWSQPFESPLKWYWSSANHRMLVGVYPSSRGYGGYVGRVRLYNETESGAINDADLGCTTPQKVAYARVFINRDLIDGTPPWFFYRLVQHELGHAFGLCHPTGSVYRDSVMIPPHPDSIAGCDWDGDLGHYSYDSCFGQDPDDIPGQIVWGADPPSERDFGHQTCEIGTKIWGVRCIYNSVG